MTLRGRWTAVAIFAAGMAWVEASVVMYLRYFLDRVDPYQTNPFPIVAEIGWIEPVRELATLLMLVIVGWLAGNFSASGLGYFLVAFGVWDIFYYAFLNIMGGWPDSLLDWDVLFLIPLPWWAPVAAPVLIASTMIVFGTVMIKGASGGERVHLSWWELMAGLLGTLFALLVFMWDAISRLPDGTAAAANALPERFMWPAFLASLLLLAVPVVGAFRRHAVPEKRSVLTGDEHGR
jgi:hypothetical protein